MTQALENFLTWSEHRAKTLNTCPRQYAYRYIEAWEGWLQDAPPPKQHAYWLNAIISDLRIATGNIVHDRAGRIVRRLASAMQIVPSTEITIAEEDFDKFICNSRKLPLNLLSSKRKKLLADLLEQPLPDAFVATERESISKMLRNFFGLPEVALFKSNPDCLLRNFAEAELGQPTRELGVPSRLMTDAVFFDGQTTVVADWKTGKPRPEHRDKGIVYDLFVRNRLGMSESDRIVVRFIYLRSGERTEFEFTPEERAETLWRVGEEFAYMQEKSSDPVLNIASLDAFHAQTGFHCLSCAHQLICERFEKDSARGFFERFQREEICE